jgi:hypothetical protein
MKFGDFDILGRIVGFQWDSGNTRGTITLGPLRINFGYAAVSNGTVVTYHTAFDSTIYGGSALLHGITAITGDQQSGQSIAYTDTSTFTWYHGSATYNGNDVHYVVVGDK